MYVPEGVTVGIKGRHGKLVHLARTFAGSYADRLDVYVTSKCNHLWGTNWQFTNDVPTCQDCLKRTGKGE